MKDLDLLVEVPGLDLEDFLWFCEATGFFACFMTVASVSSMLSITFLRRLISLDMVRVVFE